MAKLTQEEFVARATKIHNGKYDYSKVRFENIHSIIVITCPVHGDFSQLAYSHLNGYGCRKCANETLKKKVYGVGINDSDIKRRNPIYSIWHSILARCYAKDAHIKYPSYKGCSVCEDWLYLSRFKEWYESNYIEGYDIDKDLMVKGNKIYSPDTCCFIPHNINTIIAISRERNHNLPIGVVKCKGGYQARMGKDRRIIGFYKTPEAAFLAYKKAKEQYVMELAEKYYKEGKITERVYNALLAYRVEITD